MHTLKVKLKRHISFREIAGALFAMLVLTVITAILASQFQWCWVKLNTHILDDSSVYTDTDVQYNEDK